MNATIAPTEIDELAPMPASVAQLAQMVASSSTNVVQIARVIELDTALTASLLRLANSAWSASARPILTVRDAVARLGPGRILKLAAGQCVMGPMSRRMDGYELAERELWVHSVAAALAAEHLPSVVSQPVPAAAFTAALLHDVGKLVLSQHIGTDHVAEIRHLMAKEKMTYLEAEHRVLGTDHTRIGAAVAQHWEFPEVLVKAIANHHDPDHDPDPVTDAVHLANVAAKLVGSGLGTEQMYLTASPTAARRIGLTSSALESLCAVVRDTLESSELLQGSQGNGA